jgi:hypothetical protein
MEKRPTTTGSNRKSQKADRRYFSARFPDGTIMQRVAYQKGVFTHAYLVHYKRPDGVDGFQRAFCQSWEVADGKVEAEKRWLSRHGYTFIESFIVDVLDITDEIKKVK